MTKAQIAKAKLHRSAIEVGDFSGSANMKTVEKVQFVRLDIALQAIDDVSNVPTKKMISDKIRELLPGNHDNAIIKCSDEIQKML